MKRTQAIVGGFALLAAALECYYLLGAGRWSTNAQPLTAMLYILFFWILWGYARIKNFIPPLLNAGSGPTKLLALMAIAVPTVIALWVGSATHDARASMARFGVLNAAIMACYLLVAIVSVFGDRWLGVIARALKLGQEFPRDEKP